MTTYHSILAALFLYSLTVHKSNAMDTNRTISRQFWQVISNIQQQEEKRKKRLHKSYIKHAQQQRKAVQKQEYINTLVL